jgi:hypothetical protein
VSSSPFDGRTGHGFRPKASRREKRLRNEGILQGRTSKALRGGNESTDRPHHAFAVPSFENADQVGDVLDSRISRADAIGQLLARLTRTSATAFQADANSASRTCRPSSCRPGDPPRGSAPWSVDGCRTAPHRLRCVTARRGQRDVRMA